MLDKLLAETNQIYDYLTTLPDEVTFVWTSSHDTYSLGNFIYLSARYSPFLSMPVTLLGQLPDTMGIETCRTLLYVSSAIQSFQVTVSQALFVLRGYAISRHRKYFLSFVAISFIIGISVVCVFLALFLPTTTFALSPFPETTGCFKTGISHFISGVYVLIVVTEGILLASTTVHLKHYFPDRPKLLGIMIKEGVIYSVLMLCFSSANIMVIYLAQDEYSDLLTTYQCVFHTILASHLHLHLNQTNTVPPSEDNTQISSIVFRAGNEA